jgi:membrane protease YdiL (CAAX protease family)
MAFGLLFVLAAAVLAIPTVILVALFHVRVTPSGEPLLAFAEGYAALCISIAFWIMVRFVDRRSLASAGFARRGFPQELLGGFGIGLILISLMIGFLALSGVYHLTGHNPHFHPWLPLFLFLCVAVFEETVFRGYVFQTLELRWGTGAALAISAVLFGLIHLGNDVSGLTPFQKWASPIFLVLEAGLPLAGAYLLTRRLWLPIGLHWAWNFFEGPFYGTPVSGVVDPNTVLYAHLTGPFLATGGSFGPEGSLTGLTVGITAGLLLFYVAIRRGQWRSRPSQPSTPA